MRIPLAKQLDIKAFSGGSITELESGLTNAMVQMVGDIAYVTQRPGIDVFEDAGAQGAGSKGRGIFFWADNNATYLCNDGTLYKGNQGTSISTALTTGTDRVYWLPIGGSVIVLDPQNDEAWSIASNDTVTQITDTDFPTEQTTPIGLADGGAYLNNALYVLGENGVIYGSDSGDGTSWSALNFITASRDPDGGVYLGKHHDSLIAFGFSTIEVYYDAANTTGSPLSRRQDVSYNIGCHSGQAVWEIGDRLFWVGVDAAGAFGVYIMEQFQIRKISTASIDSFITQAILKENYILYASGFSGAGHDFYLLTIATGDLLTPETTLCYDDTSGIWSPWSMTINDITQLPLKQWTKRYGSFSQFGQGILANGDLISINDNIEPIDTLLGYIYVEEGATVEENYVVDGYVQSTTAVGADIAWSVRTGMFDGQTNSYKIPESLRFVGNRTDTSQTLTVKWSDERNDNFNTGRTMDTSTGHKVHRLGRFQRRNHDLSMTGDEQFYLEALELPLRVGND
jgi:hypothetical protein